MPRILAFLPFLALVWGLSVQAGELTPLNTEAVNTLSAQGALLVDIRTPAEWKATGVIPGSHLQTFFNDEGRFDLPAFANALNQFSPDPSKPVVLVCRSGHRSEQAGKLLAALWPDRRILHLDHGIKAWMGEGRATVPPQVSP